MGLETGEFISDLNPVWPLGTDFKSEGDDHLRLVKKTVQQSWPLIDAPVNLTPTQLNDFPADIQAALDAIKMPRGQLWGLTLESTLANTITISAGQCRDTTDINDMILAVALAKTTDAAWVEGDTNGGAFTALAATTWAHVFLIRQDSDGAIDAGFDTNVNATNIPAGWTAYRRVGSIYLDTSNNDIQPFTQNGDLFLWNTPEFATNSIATVRTPVSLLVPPDVRVMVRITAGGSFGSNAQMNTRFFHEEDDDNAAPVSGNSQLHAQAVSGDAGDASNTFDVLTNTTQQIFVRTAVISGAPNYNAYVNGWIDSRGRLA